MLINLKVKTLDARTHDFSIDNELTIRQFKEQIAEKTNIAAENQRIIYQGRVLADDKQVKEYDVDGKVLHVAERPPFSQRGANATNNDEPMRGFRGMPGRPTPRNLRNAPYFRALDGMLVGTMAIPVNNGPLTAAGARTPPNRFPNSSSFCINRITVAQHMIDCANNIAAYLENPEIGLNNQPLDILQRGHWTMESTVVEVGVSSTDLPRNNNIIDMVQDAVTAALSRNTPGRNYTVVQLPTVYTNEEGEQQQQQRSTQAGGSSEGATSGAVAGSDTSEETTAAAAVIIEDVIETDDEAAEGAGTPPGEDERSSSPQETDGATGSAPATAAGAAEDNATNAAAAGIGPRRRTRPQVLASVFQRYRSVETRLSPFLDRYYEILQQDPNFEEQDTAGRENAQRIYDRVSEALHYLSHAQHAISDLMLDLSQPGPRVLTCRPILVEQSGYIRSNNIFTPNLVATPLAELIAQVPPAQGAASSAATAAVATQQPEQLSMEQQLELDTYARAVRAAVPVPLAAAAAPAPDQTQNPPSEQQQMDELYARAFAFPRGTSLPRAGAAATTPTQSQTEPEPVASDDSMAAGVAEADAAAAVVAGLMTRNNDNVEDPVDEPMVAPTTANAAAGAQPQPRPEVGEMDPHVQMARLIQAVVNSATNDTDLRLEFNVPNVMSINLPVHVMTAAVHPQGRPAAATDSTGTATGDANAAAAAGATPPAAPGAAAGGGAAAAAAGAPPTAASTSSGTRSGEQRANTLPTTATQTRSTSRPQIQIGGNNNWAGRIAPTHTAFDRFLPCNSHHIREPETLIQHNNNNNNNNSNNINTTTTSNRRSANAAAGNAAVIASRLPPRSQSGTSLARPMSSRRRAAINRENRSGSVPGMATVANAAGGGGGGGGGGSSGTAASSNASYTLNRRALPPNIRPMQRTISRLISAMFDNFLVTNMRNHAQTALAGNVTASNNAADNTVGSNPTVSLSVAAAADASLASTPIAGNSVTSIGPVTSAVQVAAGSGAAGGAGATVVVREQSSDLRAQLRSFLNHSVFEGAPINEETMPSAIGRALDWFGDSLLYLPQYERPEYNSRDSVCNTLRQSLRLVIELCYRSNSCGSHFEQQLKQICEQFRKRLYSVLFLCLGSVNAELYWRQLMRLLCVPLRSNFRNEALQFLCIYIDPTIPAHTDTADAQQFLVLRDAQSSLPLDPFVAPPPLAFHPQPLQQQQQQQSPPAAQSLDSDIEMAEVASSSSSSASELEPALPAVTVGSEPWHNNFPNDWLPVITRDLQTQAEQNRPQPPYSDAYISGMSAKRRKIIQSEKPPNVECLIASGVQRALQSTGLSGPNGPGVNAAVNPDVVINAIAHDAVVQASYTEAVRSNARERLKQDIDYKPGKYPQIAKFTEQK
ncbi:large proline-rich protein BAG6 isoform X2 [Drosophila virilis]|uniref:large proline-rich protein BAG6 isoform X2 n=1 Tax=Drosophila virilis TaxID=7244 RepID=UPI001396414E|nr:large proline-rich protein BAG6 isoform X2 [Drosophila virilis]